MRQAPPHRRRARAPSGLLSLLRLLPPLLLLAAPAAAKGADGRDCSAGCPLSVGEGVCGHDGVTYLNACLAECSGTAAAFNGACPSTVGPPSAGGPKAPDSLGDSGLGQFLFETGPSGSGRRLLTAGAERTVTVSRGADFASVDDINRFASEGMVLIGPAKIISGADGPLTSKPTAPDPDADVLPGDRLDLRRIRVLFDKGLVYASRQSITTTGRRMSGLNFEAAGTGAARASSIAPVLPPPSASAPAVHPAVPIPAAAGASDSVGAAGAGSASAMRQQVPGMQGDPRLPGFVRVSSMSPGLPYTAIGWISGSVQGWYKDCTATMMSKHAAVSAGHCSWDKAFKAFIGGVTFAPHMYCPNPTVDHCGLWDFVKPFGTQLGYSTDTLGGYKSSGKNVKPWKSDVSVFTFQAPVGDLTGYLGYAYDVKGVTGQLRTAGYPNDQVLYGGDFFKLANPCSVRDTNGKDSKLDFKQYPAPPKTSTCLTNCTTTRPGQSGSAAFLSDADGGFTIRAVLSYGPTTTGNCFYTSLGYDTYAQFGPLEYGFLNYYRDWAPPA